jgi:hypothetical protein
MLALVWFAWNPPIAQTSINSVSIPIPNIKPLDAGPWRVITRRMVWKQGVDDMEERLLDAGLKPEIIQKREPTELHAFDDPRIFQSFGEASKVKAMWNKLGIDADVLNHLTKDDKPVFKVGLGRFYLIEYAQRMQEKLKKTKLPYIYEQRTVTIPGYRFVFPAMSKDEAEILWKRLQDMGVGDPVVIQQQEFEKLYANKSEKRSNK